MAAVVYLALLALVRADAEPDAEPAADPAASPDAAAAAAADPAASASASADPSAALPSFGASYGGHTAQLPAHGGYGAPPPRKQVYPEPCKGRANTEEKKSISICLVLYVQLMFICIYLSKKERRGANSKQLFW